VAFGFRIVDIIIEPKTGFGTGHHETTHMMIQHLLEMDVSRKLWIWSLLELPFLLFCLAEK
jgi:hypothetical protein